MASRIVPLTACVAAALVTVAGCTSSGSTVMHSTRAEKTHAAKASSSAQPQPLCTSGTTTGSSLYPGLFDQGTPVGRLSSVLDAAERDPDLSTDATTLADAIDALPAPKPLTVLEALGRAAWSSDVQSTLDALETAVQQECQVGLSDGNPFYNLAPAHSGSTVTGTDSVYDRCYSAGSDASDDGTLVRYLAPFTAVVSCPTGVWTIDLTTGTPHHLPLQQASSLTPASSDDTVAVGATSAEIAWATSTITKASGLSPERWTVALHIRRTNGTVVADVPLTTPKPEDGGPDSATLYLEGLDPGHFLVSIEAGDDNVAKPNIAYLVDATGKIVRSEHYSDGDQGAVSLVAGSAYRTGLDSPIRDARTFSVYDLPPPNRGNDFHLADDGGCADSATIYYNDLNNGDLVAPSTVLQGPAGVSVTATAVAGFDPTHDGTGVTVIGTTRYGVVVQASKVEMLKVVNRHYQVAWALPTSVVPSAIGVASVVLGWVVVRNTSNQSVIVDPATGKQATGLDAAETSLILGLAGNEGGNTTAGGVERVGPDDLVIDSDNGVKHVDATVCR